MNIDIFNIEHEASLLSFFLSLDRNDIFSFQVLLGSKHQASLLILHNYYMCHIISCYILCIRIITIVCEPHLQIITPHETLSCYLLSLGQFGTRPAVCCTPWESNSLRIFCWPSLLTITWCKQSSYHLLKLAYFVTWTGMMIYSFWVLSESNYQEVLFSILPTCYLSPIIVITFSVWNL